MGPGISAGVLWVLTRKIQQVQIVCIEILSGRLNMRAVGVCWNHPRNRFLRYLDMDSRASTNARMNQLLVDQNGTL